MRKNGSREAAVAENQKGNRWLALFLHMDIAFSENLELTCILINLVSPDFLDLVKNYLLGDPVEAL